MSETGPRLPSPEREQKLAELVALIVETSIEEQELLAFSNEYQRYTGRAFLNSEEQAPFGGSFIHMHRTSLVEARRRINDELPKIGGIPCSYVDKRTKQLVTSSFIGWHGIVPTEPAEHYWRPAHTPLETITVSATFLDTLQSRYSVGPAATQTEWREPGAYL